MEIQFVENSDGYALIISNDGHITELTFDGCTPWSAALYDGVVVRMDDDGLVVEQAGNIVWACTVWTL